MMFRNTTPLLLGLLLLLNGSALAIEAQKPTKECVQLSEFYSSISAESTEWRRSLLDALSNPADICEELKLGLLLSHPMVNFQNDSRALKSLKNALPLLPDSAVDRPVLSMLIGHINERQVLRNMLGKTDSQLKTLQGQIDQLKNLEAQLEDKARAVIETEAGVETEIEAEIEVGVEVKPEPEIELSTPTTKSTETTPSIGAEPKASTEK